MHGRVLFKVPPPQFFSQIFRGIFSDFQNSYSREHFRTPGFVRYENTFPLLSENNSFKSKLIIFITNSTA